LRNKKNENEDMLWREIIGMFVRKEEERRQLNQRRMSMVSMIAHPEPEYGEEGYSYKKTLERIDVIQKNIKKVMKDSEKEDKLRNELRKMYKDICYTFLPVKSYIAILKKKSFDVLKDYARDIAKQIIIKMDDLILENPKLYNEISIQLGKIEWAEGSLILNAMHKENLIKEKNKNDLRWGNGKVLDIAGAKELAEAMRDRNSGETRFYDEKFTLSHFVWNKLT